MEKKELKQQQIDWLKAPLPPEAIKPHPTKQYLSTIKAIYVIERFNEVFGLGGWFINNEVVEIHEKNIVVKSTFNAPAYGIIIPDIFGGNDNPDRGDAYKGACTDALTKIGSYLYVGMDVFKGLSEKVKGHVSTAETFKDITMPQKKTKRSDWYYELRDGIEAATSAESLGHVEKAIVAHKDVLSQDELADLRTQYKRQNNKLVTKG